MYVEKKYNAANGFLMLLVWLAAMLGTGALAVTAFQSQQHLVGLLWILVAFAALIAMSGLFIVQPNEAKALVLFGTYKGTVRQDGFWWANPFLTKQAISLRVRNFETAKLKVNDNHSNPIEIAAIVVWKVVDSAEALFEVDDYARYVEVQSESALRGVAVQYAYDSHTSGELSLSQNTDEVSNTLEKALVDRLKKAGVEVVEARISHLAYSPEIAAAMLQRQQASAIISARQKIVEGAVGMVELAMEQIHAKKLADFTPEQKAEMVTNLLVVLVSERGAQPVVSTGQ